jgi:hypothetical protein
MNLGDDQQQSSEFSPYSVNYSPVMEISLLLDQKYGSKDKWEVWSHTDRVKGPEETKKARSPLNHMSEPGVLVGIQSPTNSVGVPVEMVEVWLPSDLEEDSIERPLNWRKSYAVRPGRSFHRKWRLDVYVQKKEIRTVKVEGQHTENFNEDKRQIIFDSLYNSKNKTRQWDFIKTHMRTKTAVIHRQNSKRMVTREYFLPKTLAGNQVDLRVSQYFFLNTLAITQQ